MTSTRVTIGEVVLNVSFKQIRNLHLSVLPPFGDVVIAAPDRMSLDAVRAFALKKLRWIRRQRSKLLAAERAAKLEYLDRESHYVWGRRHLLRISNEAPAGVVSMNAEILHLQVPVTASTSSRERYLAKWYRGLILDAAPTIVDSWAKFLRVPKPAVRVRHMRTRWGSCNPRSGVIQLNTELAKKPMGYLEYVILHEMVHLLERTHNRNFVAAMDRAMPTWRARRDALNDLPVPTH
jgi:predicted metal-dependent hydrolase